MFIAATKRSWLIGFAILSAIACRVVAAADDKPGEAQTVAVAIEATWLSITPEFVREQKLDLRELFTVKKTGEKITGNFIDTEMAQDLVALARKTRQGTVLAAPRLLLPDGEKGSLAVAQQQAYVSGWSDAKEGEKRKAQISTAQSGVFLDVVAAVSADRKYVTLALSPRVSQLLDLKNVVWEKAPQEKLMIQQPVMMLHETNTVMSLPDEGTMALVVDRKDNLKEDRDKICLLLIRPTIVYDPVVQPPK